jgi:hypothetical protein
LKTITVRIGKDGKLLAETHGLKGTECLKYVEPLQQLLDAEVVDSEYTNEFFESTEIGPVTTAEQSLDADIGRS